MTQTGREEPDDLESLKQVLEAQNMPFIEATAQWRVDVLQKLEKFFPIMYRTISPTVVNKLTLLTSIQDLLIRSQSFLGQITRFLFFQFLLERLNDDDGNIKDTTRLFILSLEGNCDLSLESVPTSSFRFNYWEEIRTGIDFASYMSSL